MNNGRFWPNGSYFISNYLNDNHLSCIHSSALDAVNDGGWILPSGNTCTSSTSPMQCNTIAASAPTNITLQRVSGFEGMELVYKCCLPNGCDAGLTDIIIANIYGKLYQIF